MEKRVVITGIGAITPIGNNVEEFWYGLKEGKCGIAEITAFDTTEQKVHLAGEVKKFNPEEHFDKRSCKRSQSTSRSSCQKSCILCSVPECRIYCSRYHRTCDR